MKNSELNTCCSKPSIQSMDYSYPVFEEFEHQVTKINRICLHCFSHWFGVDGNIKYYTSKEWDVYIESSLVDM